MYISNVTECNIFEEKTLFLLYLGDRVIVPVKCCLTYIYLSFAEEGGSSPLTKFHPNYTKT